MLVGHGGERGIALRGVVVEAPLHDARALVAGDGERAVLAQGIEHDDVVRPAAGIDAVAEIALLVQRQYEHGDAAHAGALPAATPRTSALRSAKRANVNGPAP